MSGSGKSSPWDSGADSGVGGRIDPPGPGRVSWLDLSVVARSVLVSQPSRWFDGRDIVECIFAMSNVPAVDASQVCNAV